jgi:putative ABC transport system permease protein
MIEYQIKIKRERKNIFQDGWVWRMAWRDGRHNFSRLFLFVASLITGIAALVSIGSLNYSLQDELNRNAKELLGADLVVNSNKKIDTAFYQLLDSNASALAQDAEMASMVMFMNSRQSRLVKLTAWQGDFPFYGQLVTAPADAYQRMQSGEYAMLDETLATQYEISSDDSLKIGNRMFKVAGVVRKIPGGGQLTSTLAPAVYISLRSLDSTGLVQFGSRVAYSVYVKNESEKETNALVAKLNPIIGKYGYSYETVAARREGLGEGFQSVYRFFSLLAFVALLLGCVGVASSVHIYAREKREEVAVLRCMGSTGWQAFTIYFIQILFLGCVGSVLGAAIGMALQQLIPVVFGDYLPVQVTFAVSWRALLEGVVLGVVVSVLFTLLPLVNVRFVPPLAVLRSDSVLTKRFSKTRAVAMGLIVLFPIVAAAYQTQSAVAGLLFGIAIALALGGLVAIASLLLWLVRQFFPVHARFVFRHALSNLFRPNNQTTVLLVTIGLGAFIIATLNITQSSLLNQVEFTGTENQSNTILFDIQTPQRDGVVALMNEQGLPVNQVVPIVTCRLLEIKGKSIEAIQKDTAKIPDWALTREYRVTYRDSLHLSEKLIKGQLQRVERSVNDSIFVTISEGMHETLNVQVGDSLVFDIQGVPLKAHISGIRQVDWPKDPPNFIFVFPTGVLENAPQIWVAATRIEEDVQAATFQQRLVLGFPNVSLIDLRLILATVQELFDKVAMVVRFLAFFSIVTGLVVLAGAVLNSRFARMKENALLRTLGARTRQIALITLIEYCYLGFFAALTGILFAVGAGWLLCRFFFEVAFAVAVGELAYIAVGVLTMTVLIGWLNSRKVIRTPPLQVLRKEG